MIPLLPNPPTDMKGSNIPKDFEMRVKEGAMLAVNKLLHILIHDPVQWEYIPNERPNLEDKGTL